MRSGDVSSSSRNACNDATNPSHVIGLFFMSAPLSEASVLPENIRHKPFTAEAPQSRRGRFGSGQAAKIRHGSDGSSCKPWWESCFQAPTSVLRCRLIADGYTV